ncbi:MAG: glutamate 5-kinase [bacterium]|nr:glutamate 5-kinase [bacterium]
MRERVSGARRIVVKVGTNVLSDDRGRISGRLVGEIARQVAALRRDGREVILVTSGAIAAGMEIMGLSRRPRSLPRLQAAAAVGQGSLMHLYAGRFGEHGARVAQILLTADDLKARHRHLNARLTIMALLEGGIVPVINENDTVSTEEIRFGDNDILSALVAALVGADLLVILTDAPGLMTADPRKGRGELIGEVRAVDARLEAAAGGAGTARGTGGMASKLRAARLVTSYGAAAVVADGREADILLRVAAGEAAGTLFHPAAGRMEGRKRWIAYFIKPRGEIVIDDGAAAAIAERGKSLLPTGVREVRGDFRPGDTVRLVTLAGREIARGLANYSSGDIGKIMGKRTAEIRAVLGHGDYDEVVHRDNLALI